MASLPAQHFEDLYSADPDPWRIGTGWYEARKRGILAALLPEPRYRVALEPGCGNGDLTAVLRRRCERLIAWDAVDTAAIACRQRFADDDGVEVHTGYFPDQWPAAPPADLLVISEIGYYLDAGDLGRFLARADSALAPGATVLAAHWQWPAAGYPQTGAEVHARLRDHHGWQRLGGYADPDVQVDLFTVGGDVPRSVAQRAGVVG